MGSEPNNAGGSIEHSYLVKTRRPLNCLMFLLPLLVAYEAGQKFYRDDLIAPASLAALLEPFGAPARFVPPVLIVLVLLSWQVLSRQPWHVDGEVLLGMYAESVVAMMPLFGLSKLLTAVAASLPSLASGGLPAGTAAQLLSGIGAGIYEEFLFRLIAIGLLLVLTVDVLNAPRKPMVVMAIVLSSVVFSHSHFLGGEHFNWGSFTFRALAGAYLAVIYVFRGFGIAVGTHACWNVALALLPM